MIKTNTTTLLTLLTNDNTPTDDILNTKFIIHNKHNLHTHPNTILINTIKQFNNNITITNLNNTDKPTNKHNLIKIITLNVKKNHRLHFTTQNTNTKQTLKTIDDTIATNLKKNT